MENINNNTHTKLKTSPRDFFLHLGVMVSLYISTISVITLWFKIIDKFFADPLKYLDPYGSGVSMAVASLFVVFPVFILISWVLHKNEMEHPKKRELVVRKWLIYLTLFVSGIVIVVDLVTLINIFLSGREITSSFMSKILVVFIVIGVIFAYYLHKVRTENGLSKSLARKLTWSVTLFVIASISIGFIVIGSPQTQRMKRMDNERISNIQNIQWGIVNYWQREKKLPSTLNDLEDSISGYVVPVDPRTDKPYKYGVVGENAFQLCAIFDLENKQPQNSGRYPFKSVYNETWKHGKGEVCFERKIDPKKYKFSTSNFAPPY